MEEKLQLALTELLEKTMDKGGNLLGFLEAELPDVLSQLLMWKMFESIFWVVLSLVLMFGMVVYWYYVTKNIEVKSDPNNWNQDDFYYGIGGIISMIFVAVILKKMSLTCLKIWVAPKVFLFEYIPTMFK